MKNESNALSKEALSHRTYVENLQKYYRENDIRAEDPNEGVWNLAHYPLPKRLGGILVIPLLEEHHAIQGVLQSEEFGVCCTSGRYDKWLRGTEYEKIYLKWMAELGAEGGKVGGAAAWKKNGEKHIEAAVAARSKEVVFEKGTKTFTYPSLRKGCAELGLSAGAMSHVIHGIRNHHKGFIAYYV